MKVRANTEHVRQQEKSLKNIMYVDERNKKNVFLNHCVSEVAKYHAAGS